MVEIMKMQHQSDQDISSHSWYCHGSWYCHPDMPKRLTNCHVLILNVSRVRKRLKSIQASFIAPLNSVISFVESERQFIDARVKKIVEFKRLFVMEMTPVSLLFLKRYRPLGT